MLPQSISIKGGGAPRPKPSQCTKIGAGTVWDRYFLDGLGQFGTVWVGLGQILLGRFGTVWNGLGQMPFGQFGTVLDGLGQIRTLNF